MNFSSIIGQDQIKAQLINTVVQQRISHAQLFLGHEGYGNLPLALAYAKYIMCLAPVDGDSCGVCSACRKVEKLEHPDLHFVFPIVAKDGEKATSDFYLKQWRNFIINNPYGSFNQWQNEFNAGNSQPIIRVAEGREILRKLNLKPYESEYKIMIIWFPEKMNSETSNMILKLIEEPPAKTLFFLVAQNSQLILSTILSRTQLIKIPRIFEDDLFKWLQQKHQLTSDKALQISRISDGDYINACEFIESSADAVLHFENFAAMMRTSYSGKIIEMFKWVDEVAQWGREKQKAFLTYSLRMVRENLVINQNQKNLSRMTADEDDFSSRFATFIHPGNTPYLQNEFDRAIYHITRNANAKIVLFDLCIKLNKYLKQ